MMSKLHKTVLLTNIPPCVSDTSPHQSIARLNLENKFEKFQPLPKTKDLGKLFTAARTDKFNTHHYEEYYNEWLAPYQNVKGLKLLELGAFKGNSLNVWRHFFGDASLILGLAYFVDMSTVRASAFKVTL